jgi:hypothetical protein
MTKYLPWLLALVVTVSVSDVSACDSPASVCGEPTEGGIALVEHSLPVTVLSDASADPAVKRVAASFAADLKRVSGKRARHIQKLQRVKGPVVVIGVLGQSPLIDGLVEAGKLEPGDLAGQWEGFQLKVVDNPWPKVPRALVVVGSDRRGAIYGAYDLSEDMGVSPWYWFADVPVERRSNLFVTAGERGERPAVKYRGFFINDEDPALSGWAKKRFGGVNAEMYEHVFELLLRLKGNYLWPAMWYPKAFHLDDPQNRVLADAMGVVMGTSHHEPLTRAQSEWHRVDSDFAGGAWDYRTNAENLRAFWRGGMERMMSKGDGQGYESLVTVGMRGDGDAPMAEGTAIDLLENVVADQRKIIEDVTGKPAAETPQVWALYKEVQDYYDQGMTVPEDVTLLFADDNWGQIRRLPASNFDRAGGYGVYYHFDYVGAPRNYKWLNTVQIQKVWQQMNLAYERGVKDLWVVNVGDIKPMEYPLDFFMKMAWNPEGMTAEALQAFPEQWAARTFGADVASEVAELVTTYSKYASRRKPELINENTFPLGDAGPVLDGGEFGSMVADWRTLVDAMNSTKQRLSDEEQAAFYQLVEFPIAALANLYELYYATAWNRRLASRHDPRANHFLKLAEAAFERDSQLTARYHALEKGKWDGMMNQVHMNYVHWNEPTQQTLPSLTRVAADMPLNHIKINIEFAEQSPEKTSKKVIEASRYDRTFGDKGITWTVIPDLGHSEAAVVALSQGQPPTAPDDGIRLEYDFTAEATGEFDVELHLSPTLDTQNSGGIRVGLSVDDGPVKTLASTLEPTAGGADTPDKAAWVSAVIDNRHVLKTTFDELAAGKHTLKLWRLDDNIIIEKIVISPN